MASYFKKSTIGAKRKYYYLTKLGERLFEEIVVTRLYPLIFMFTTTMDSKIEEFGVKSKIPKKELQRIQVLINEEIDK